MSHSMGLTERVERIGELMTPPTATLPDSYTVAEALTFMVKSADVSEISYIFVTSEDRLVGVVGMRDLILSKPSESLARTVNRRCQRGPFGSDDEMVNPTPTDEFP